MSSPRALGTAEVRVLPSLRARLLLLVLLTLLPALLLILYTGVEQRRLAAAAAQGDAMHVVQLAAGTHKELFAETQRLVQLLAQLPAVREGSAASCSAFLTHLFKQDPVPHYSSFSVLRPNGDVFCSSVPLKRRINAGDQAYYRRVMNSRTFAIGDYQIGRITGRAIIVLASRCSMRRARSRPSSAPVSISAGSTVSPPRRNCRTARRSR